MKIVILFVCFFNWKAQNLYTTKRVNVLSALSSDQTITPAVCTPKTERAELRTVFVHLQVYGFKLRFAAWWLSEHLWSAASLILLEFQQIVSWEKLFLTVGAVVTSVLSKWHTLAWILLHNYLWEHLHSLDWRIPSETPLEWLQNVLEACK